MSAIKCPDASMNCKTELLPCPFCGGEGELKLFKDSHSGRPEGAHVKCIACGAIPFRVPAIRDEDADVVQKQAVEMWNCRAAILASQNSPGTAIAVGHVGKGSIASFCHLNDAGRALPPGRYDLYALSRELETSNNKSEE